MIPFENIFRERDFSEGRIFKGERSRIVHHFTMDVDPGYMYIEKFRGGEQWFMMESKKFTSNIVFTLKIENGKLLSFNG